MSENSKERPAIGISACLFDCPVRYDGVRFDPLVAFGEERDAFTFTPVCPECMAGLGVPREEIDLTGPGEDVLAGKARVVSRNGRDVTEHLVAGSSACVEALMRAGVRAVILKESSPSCGIAHARILGDDGSITRAGGVFAALLRDTGWFLVPSTAFDSAFSWWDWRRRLHAWLWIEDCVITGNGDLTSAWHEVKFIVQETQRAEADRIGRFLAALPRHASIEELEAGRLWIMEALKRPTTPERAAGALWKAYAYHVKRGTPWSAPYGCTEVREKEE